MSSDQGSATAFAPEMATGRAEADAPRADLSGRDRLAWNVLASWAGQMVFVIAGFLMPRFMDRHIGQAALGVWDFGWSLVSYLSLAQGGIGSSVNRYVARFRAQGDWVSLNCAVASVMCVQLVATVLVLVLTCLGTWLVPSLLGQQLLGQIEDARWVVFLLGTSLALQMAFDSYRGVITGCHRWDLHNGINALFYAGTVVAMICLLIVGGGLRSQATAYLCGVVATEITRAAVAYRVCPELSSHLSHARWHQAREMLVFGGKTLGVSLARLLLYQTNSLIIMAVLGPAPLAAYSRSKALVGHAQTFISKFGFVLTPVAGSLQAGNRQEDLQAVLIKTSQLATYFSLPIVLLLAIMGDTILLLWMGPKYQLAPVLAILAVGHLTEMTRQPVMGILAGLNAHGRLALAGLAAALCSVALGLLTVWLLGWGLIGAAASVAVPLALVNGIYVPMCACRTVGMSMRTYLDRTNRGPVLCAIAFAAVLLLGRFHFAGNPGRTFVYGGGGAILLLSLLYWRLVLPPRIRSRILTAVGLPAWA